MQVPEELSENDRKCHELRSASTLYRHCQSNRNDIYHRVVAEYLKRLYGDRKGMLRQFKPMYGDLINLHYGNNEDQSTGKKKKSTGKKRLRKLNQRKPLPTQKKKRKKNH